LDRVTLQKKREIDKKRAQDGLPRVNFSNHPIACRSRQLIQCILPSATLE